MIYLENLKPCCNIIDLVVGVGSYNSSIVMMFQVTASVLRNLSWRAGDFIKKTLREIDAVSMLMKIALRMRKESTLKAVLSALWNLSAHSHLNKVTFKICYILFFRYHIYFF